MINKKVKKKKRIDEKDSILVHNLLYFQRLKIL